MLLNKNELKQLFAYILEDLKNKGIHEISFADEDDYYCIIAHNSKFTKCPPYAIGSLSEDMDVLKDVFDGERILMDYDFAYLGTILAKLSTVTTGKQKMLLREQEERNQSQDSNPKQITTATSQNAKIARIAAKIRAGRVRRLREELEKFEKILHKWKMNLEGEGHYEIKGDRVRTLIRFYFTKARRM